MCSRIKSVTNQIRKINAGRCEVYHKMSESKKKKLYLKWDFFHWNTSFLDFVARYCNFKVLEASRGKGGIKVHKAKDHLKWNLTVLL